MRTYFKLLAVSLCLFSTVSFASPTIVPPHYEIIVDAGSSGSRLHLFQYTQYRGLPTITDIFSENVKPGLSSFASHPNDAGASLGKLLADANTQLQTLHVNPNQVKISVMATAGMRLLSTDQQQAIYASVTSYVQTHSSFVIREIDTIPGKMEGLYGWLDVNYLQQNLQNEVNTVGSIDMGGASTQIAFATRDNTDPNNEVQFTLLGKRYTVFSISFLGLGQDQAFATMENNSNANTCFPTGYTDSKIAAGTFNYSTCQSLYTNVINSHNVMQELMANNQQDFIAYSGTYYDLSFFTNVGNLPQPTQLADLIQQTCSESWGQLSGEHPGDKYLSGYCGNAIYVSDLLFNAYQLQNTQLSVATQINGHDIDWTLGALVYHLTQE